MRGLLSAGMVGVAGVLFAIATISILFRVGLIAPPELVAESLTVILATFTIVLGVATVYLGAETRRLGTQTRNSLRLADRHHQERLAPLCKITRPVSVEVSKRADGNTDYTINFVVTNVGLGPAYQVTAWFIDPVGVRVEKGCEPIGIGERFDVPAFAHKSSAPWDRRLEWTLLVDYLDRFGSPFQTEIIEGRIRVSGPNPESRQFDDG